MSGKNDQKIALWLFCVCAMIFLMVVVGGITRLTESGLSIVKWHPISGIIPPLDEAQWHEEFEAYKAYPEYQKVNHGMSLEEFKSIFYWEYGHRVLGRLIGLAFFVPFMVFLLKKSVSPALKPQLWVMFFLGGLQGLLGWWMVKSGLVDDPDVSHYRLTAHLGLAVLIYLYMFWVACGLVMKKYNGKRLNITPLKWLIGLILIQILLGGLVAGLNAGLIYNQWPLMGEGFIPSDLFATSPLWLNFFENHTTVQFDHRMLAYVIVGLGVYVWFNLRHVREIKIRRARHALLLMILLQVTLGILTLIHAVPIPLAAAHQAGAILTLSAGLFLLRRVS